MLFILNPQQIQQLYKIFIFQDFKGHKKFFLIKEFPTLSSPHDAWKPPSLKNEQQTILIQTVRFPSVEAEPLINHSEPAETGDVP